MTWLDALAATALSLHRRLQPWPIAGGRFGGIAGAAADPLPRLASSLATAVSLAAQLRDLLLLGQDPLYLARAGHDTQSASEISAEGQPTHLMQSLAGVQTGIKLPPRVMEA